MRLGRIREWNFGDLTKATRVPAGMRSSVSVRRRAARVVAVAGPQPGGSAFPIAPIDSPKWRLL